MFHAKLALNSSGIIRKLKEAKMVRGRAAGACCVALLVFAATVSAASSDVANAAMKGDKAAVRSLLDRKADVNAPQPDGATALHWAVWREDVEMTSMLILAGANAKAEKHQGATPFYLAT